MGISVQGYVPSSLIDWPGKVCAILFLGGCNFRCPYCHAAHLLGGKEPLEGIDLDTALAHAQSRREWIDGVTVSGGEPTLCADIEQLLARLSCAGFAVKLDTNGSRPDVLRRLISKNLLDYVAMDVKAPLDERYGLITGVEGQHKPVRETLELLLSGVVPYEVRTTVVPTLHSEEDLYDMARQLRDASAWFLQAFRPVNCLDPAMRKIDRMSVEHLGAVARKLRPVARRVRVRGVADETSCSKKRVWIA